MAYETGIEGVDDASQQYRRKLYAKGDRLSGPTGPMHLENTVGGEQADPKMGPEELAIYNEEERDRGFDAGRLEDEAFRKYPDTDVPERSEVPPEGEEGAE